MATSKSRKGKTKAASHAVVTAGEQQEPLSRVERLAAYAFKPGQSGNPAGRPKGSRTKVNEYFLRDLMALWEEHGDDILAATAATKPEVIVKAMIALLPKQVEVTAPLDNMTDDQLATIAEQLLSKYGGAGKSAAGSGSAGTEAPRLPKPSCELQGVPKADGVP